MTIVKQWKWKQQAGLQHAPCNDCSFVEAPTLHTECPAQVLTHCMQVQGAAQADSLGRPQKALALPNGASSGARVRVRKMGAHNGLLHGRDAKQDRPAWQRRRAAK